MRGLAILAAAALAGPFAPVAAAAQEAIVDMVTIDLPGRVLSLRPDARQPIVLVEDGRPYVLQVQIGRLAAVPFGEYEPADTASYTNLLPQSWPASGLGGVEAAWLSDATDRYGHGVLGDRIEAGSLRVRDMDGAEHVLQLGADAVFEDLEPRLADLDGDGRAEIIVVKSYLDRGAALAVVGMDDGGELVVLHETPPIGRPNRWLNPVGAADFDGDGAVEVAYVETPHIGGTLMIWEWRDGRLVREHALAGFSNHAIGSTQLGLSVITDIDEDGLMDLAVPGRDRDRMRLIGLAGGEVRELADIALVGEVSTDIARVGGFLAFGLADGRLVALRLPH